MRPAEHGDAKRACPGCGSCSRRSLGVKSGHELARCRVCATVFVDVLPRQDQAHDYGGYYDDANLTVPAFVDRRLDEIVAGLDGYRRTNRWLDVGCGAGSLLHSAKRAGWEVEGTEISPRPVALLASHGDTVHLGDVMTLELPPGAYDVVTLIEVLEHVPRPRAMLRRVYQLLRPGGIVYLTTPHGHGISARVLALRWSVMGPPEHLQLFSVTGLRQALSDVGLDGADVRTRGVNPYELVHAMRHRREPGGRPMGGSERVSTSYQLNAALERSRPGVRVKLVSNAVLGALRLGDSLTAQAIRPELDQRASDRNRPASSGAQRW